MRCIEGTHGLVFILCVALHAPPRRVVAGIDLLESPVGAAGDILGQFVSDIGDTASNVLTPSTGSAPEPVSDVELNSTKKVSPEAQDTTPATSTRGATTSDATDAGRQDPPTPVPSHPPANGPGPLGSVLNTVTDTASGLARPVTSTASSAATATDSTASSIVQPVTSAVTTAATATDSTVHHVVDTATNVVTPVVHAPSVAPSRSPGTDATPAIGSLLPPVTDPLTHVAAPLVQSVGNTTSSVVPNVIHAAVDGPHELPPVVHDGTHAVDSLLDTVVDPARDVVAPVTSVVNPALNATTAAAQRVEDAVVTPVDATARHGTTNDRPAPVTNGTPAISSLLSPVTDPLNATSAVVPDAIHAALNGPHELPPVVQTETPSVDSLLHPVADHPPNVVPPVTSNATAAVPTIDAVVKPVVDTDAANTSGNVIAQRIPTAVTVSNQMPSVLDNATHSHDSLLVPPVSTTAVVHDGGDKAANATASRPKETHEPTAGVDHGSLAVASVEHAVKNATTHEARKPVGGLGHTMANATESATRDSAPEVDTNARPAIYKTASHSSNATQETMPLSLAPTVESNSSKDTTVPVETRPTTDASTLSPLSNEKDDHETRVEPDITPASSSNETVLPKDEDVHVPATRGSNATSTSLTPAYDAHESVESASPALDHSSRAMDHEDAPSKSTDHEDAPSKSTDQEDAPSKSTDQEDAPSKSTDQEDAPSKSTDQEDAPSKSTDQEDAPSKSTEHEDAPSKSKDATASDDAEQKEKDTLPSKATKTKGTPPDPEAPAAPAAPAPPVDPPASPTPENVLESQEAQARRAKAISGDSGAGTSALFAAVGALGCVAIIAIVVYVKKQPSEVEALDATGASGGSGPPPASEERHSDESVYNDPLGTRYSSIVMITPNGDGVCIL